jgi:hypothetical protein
MCNLGRMEFYQSVYYSMILSDLRKKSGISMRSYSDALLLSAAMESAKFSISSHTLARFFGFISRRKVYPSTLQLICNYLGFDHFDAYRSYVDRTHQRSLLCDIGLFFDPLCSIQRFEIAIQLMDHQEIELHLDCINFDHEKIEKLAHLVGYLVRYSSNQKELLTLLIKTSNGRRLFFERFVDEDDPKNYFSTTLNALYLKHVTTENNRLFYYCFLIANASYHRKKIDPNWIGNFNKETVNLGISALHFHEISRVFETKILVQFHLSKHNHQKTNSILEDMLAVSAPMEMHAQAWILARVLKALAFTHQLKQSMKHETFKTFISSVYKQSKVQSMGELIVQLVYFRYIATENQEINPPLTIQSSYFQNEYHTRLSTETATRSLFCLEPEREKLHATLGTYTKTTGTSWVMNVLENNA